MSPMLWKATYKYTGESSILNCFRTPTTDFEVGDDLYLCRSTFSIIQTILP